LDLGSLGLDSLGLDGLDLDSAPAEFLDALTDVGVESVGGRQARHLRGSLNDLLESLGDESADLVSGELNIDIWLDVETDALLQLALAGQNLAFDDGTGGTAARIGSLALETRVDPDFGVPTFLSVDIRNITAAGGSLGLGDVDGDIFLSFELTDLNTSIDITAPPVS
jgi:hypothetical protein